jgi:hypothetical protein
MRPRAFWADGDPQAQVLTRNHPCGPKRRSRNQIVSLRRLAALASHQLVEGVEVRPAASFRKKCRRVHGGELLSHGGGHELG